MTPGGNTVPGTWTAANGQLCLSNGTAQECVPYTGPFQAGHADDADQLVQRDRDVARAVDQPPPAPAQGASAGAKADRSTAESFRGCA